MFRQRYPKGYQKWAKAAELLWSSDSSEWTTIGHLCREAVQEFAAELFAHFQPPRVNPDKTKTVDWVRSVLNAQRTRLGEKERLFLDALFRYWGTLIDLIQRQEHDSLKEAEPLVREDARRVVFQTAVVMFEIDRSLSWS